MAKTERSGHTTTDHDFIRRWVEERGGWPARVKGTGGKNDPGLIRIDFPGFSGKDSLERIEWDQWFQGFEANGLAFLHRDLDHGGGDLDRFNKLVARGDEDGGGARGKRGRSAVASSARKSTSTRSTSGRSSSARSTSTRASGSRGSGAKSDAGKTNGARGSTAGGAGKGSRARQEADGAAGEMRGLLLHELADLLSAERQFLTTTRAMVREAQDPDVKARTEEHVTETEGQIERLRQAFAALGERPKAVKCEAALGLKEEHDSFKSEEKPSKQLLSVFDLGSGLRVEHYEIAAYRSAIAVASALGEKECAQLLKDSLKEEVAMASFLEKNAKVVLKRVAAGEKAAGTGARSASRGGRRAARA